jgi:hypothetical protein
MTANTLMILRRQLAELDGILADAQGDLNAIRGRERLGNWKVQTLGLLRYAVGAAAAQRFSAIHVGPSFTQDLLEELTDEVEPYRNCLSAIIESLEQLN